MAGQVALGRGASRQAADPQNTESVLAWWWWPALVWRGNAPATADGTAVRVIVGQTHGRDPGFGAAVTCACRLAEAPGGLPPAWQSARQAAPQASGRRRTFSDPTNELSGVDGGDPISPISLLCACLPVWPEPFYFSLARGLSVVFFLVLWVNDSATVFLGLSRARWMLPW